MLGKKLFVILEIIFYEQETQYSFELNCLVLKVPKSIFFGIKLRQTLNSLKNQSANIIRYNWLVTTYKDCIFLVIQRKLVGKALCVHFIWSYIN